MARFTLVYSDDLLTRQYLSRSAKNYVDVITPKNFRREYLAEDWGSSIFVFTGGGDICPTLYGQIPKHRSCPAEPTERDLFELAVVMTFSRNYKIGICRGAQLLWVAVGEGKLIQHIDGHSGENHVTKATKLAASEDYPPILVTNSDHHQAMEFRSLPENGRFYYNTDVLDGNTVRPTIELAVLTNPSTCILTQGHPEYPGAPKAYTDLFNSLVLSYTGERI